MTSVHLFTSCNNYSVEHNDQSKVIDENSFYGKPEEYVVGVLGKASEVIELVAINKCWYIYKNPKNVKCNTLKIRFSNWIPQEGIVDKVNCN